jgi:hypothetical protein
MRDSKKAMGVIDDVDFYRATDYGIGRPGIGESGHDNVEQSAMFGLDSATRQIP